MKLFAVLGPVFLVALVGCKKDPSADSGRNKSTSGTAPPTAASAQGSGDGSGSSVQNARGLTAEVGTNFSLSCDATMYFGPFRFTKDPEVLTLTSTIKSPSGVQICVGGEWVDKTGAHVGGAAIGCVDDKHVVEGKPAFEYSPGNGGASANPVYMKVSFAEPKPSGCPTLNMTLKM